MPKDPNFFCIGAQKAATTWLHRMLQMHPDVFVPERKELYFFSRRGEYARGIDWYRSQFAPAIHEKAIGELTADYLWATENSAELSESDRNSGIPALVKKHYPDQKFIVILRDPVERAISSFYHQIRARRVSPASSIMQAGKHFGILSMGYYDEYLERWFSEFDRERFLILMYEEDVRMTPMQSIKRVYEFLGVDADFEPSNVDKRVHVASTHLYMRINYYLPMLGRLVRSYPSLLFGLDWKIDISDEDLKLLAEHFQPHNERLSNVLGRSLPWVTS